VSDYRVVALRGVHAQNVDNRGGVLGGEKVGSVNHLRPRPNVDVLIPESGSNSITGSVSVSRVKTARRGDNRRNDGTSNLDVDEVSVHECVPNNHETP
jgi:hypothetical protein